jgi:fumarate reductase flavoprotein subunit
MITRKVPATGETAENLETQIIVVGAGGAGLAAAVAAAEMGANVIGLERHTRPGGNTALAIGFFAAESPAQKRALIDAPRDHLFKRAISYAHLRINPRVLRAFIDKSGDTVRWLEEKGLRIEKVIPLYLNQSPLTWHIPAVMGNKPGGAMIIEVLTDKCTDLGVRLLCGVRAKKILTDGSGGICGVRVAIQGREFEIKSKSVILATGGYGGNKDLLKKYYPFYQEDMRCIGVPNMGDGLILATEVGAATEGLGVLQLSGLYVRTRASITIKGPKPREISFSLSAIAWEPYTVWVNKKGERFIDEIVANNHFESGNVLPMQPDAVAYALIDSKIVQGISECGLIVGLRANLEDQRSGLPGLENQLHLAAEKGEVKISNSWDDIAHWIGVAPPILKATIEEYNACCDTGYDRLFAKDRQYLIPLRNPPYYALRAHSDFLGTIGGIKINEYMEVVDNRGDRIPGLYTAGVDAGGWAGDTYYANNAGGTLGFALNSGRIAGENAAKFCLAGSKSSLGQLGKNDGCADKRK